MEDQALNSLRRINGVSAAFVVDPNEPAPEGGVPEAQGALLGAVVAALAQASDDLNLGAFGETIIEAERETIWSELAKVADVLSQVNRGTKGN